MRPSGCGSKPARYVGTDNKGQQFVITAKRAIQRSSDVPIVDIQGMFAQLALAQGPLMIAANQGRYNLDTQKVAIDGPGAGRRPRRLSARDPRRHGRSQAAPAGQRRPGRGPDAARPVPGRAASAPTSASRTVVLDGGARLKIVQGAVR